VAVFTRRVGAAQPLTDGSWESVHRPLARLRVAIEVAEDELLRLRRAYDQLLEPTPSPVLGLAATNRLSAQENRVAILLAGGHQDKEIARLLHVSVNTVKTQVKSILRKLNVRSRWEVARVLAEGDRSD
jgi:DNA-binding NarL/FixJ family response regulator